MGFGDLFKATQNANLKEENDALRQRVADLESQMTPEMQDHDRLVSMIIASRSELEKIQQTMDRMQVELQAKLTQLEQAKKDVIEVREEALFQSFGLYTPTFDFATSDIYKDRLDKIREQQKTMIKNGSAVSGNMNWTVNGSEKQGQKMVRDMQKLLLRAFNGECDELVGKVKYNNLDSALKRMESSVSAISKLGSIMNVAITPKYLTAKETELKLAYEYQLKKQEEKELLKEERARMREEAKLQKELEVERKKLEKEQTHYQNAYNTIQLQLAHAAPEEIEGLQAKKAELEQHLGELAKSIENVDYRAANQRAGYVYIISNIGAFGEDVYKIGMTRRLDPMERVDELGDASVPFNFDVHAMIFSDDAPKLEAALHEAFADKKLNMVNTRREFFHVTLDEIEAVVRKNYDKTVEFIRIPPAEQYRQSQLIHQAAE